MSRLSDLLAMSRKTETLAEKPQPKQGDQLSKGLTETTSINQAAMSQDKPTAKTNKVTSMSNPSTQPQETTAVQPFDISDIKKEFSILDHATGKTAVTRRGIARLCGAHLNAVQYQLSCIEKATSESDQQKLPEILQTFAGQGFKPDQQIPDVLAAALIKYYAYQGKKEAQKVDAFLGAVGLRTVIQTSLGWSKIPSYVKPTASEWERRFEQPFYTQLERLTGLKPQGHKRPQLWAKLTKELFCDWLPNGVYEDLKRYQQAGDKNAKLHQYLGEDGVKVFTTHMEVLFTLMHAAQSTEHLLGLLTAHHNQAYQGELKLLDPNKKERAAKWLELAETELAAIEDIDLATASSLAHKIHTARVILN